MTLSESLAIHSGMSSGAFLLSTLINVICALLISFSLVGLLLCQYLKELQEK